MNRLLRSGNAQKRPRVCPGTKRTIDTRLGSRWFSLLYIFSGLLALLWFLVRVLPKPSRAAYPCQRVALPMASAFVLWIAGIGGTLLAFRNARKHLKQARYALAAVCVAAGVVIAAWALTLPMEPASAAWDPVEAPNTPLGTARGVHPGRVVWVHDPDATNWDGSSNYWWSPDNTDQVVVEEMVSKCIRSLAGESTDAEAWDAIFRNFNTTHGRGDTGYQAGEGIAIKLNLNVTGSYSTSNRPFPSPQVVLSLTRQLIHTAGVEESAITFYDASRCIPDAIYSPLHVEFPGVHIVDNDGQADRELATEDPAVPVYYSGPDAGASGTSRLPTHVVNATYLINFALLRGHSLAGVTLCAKNHFGSIWRPDSSSDRGWKPSNLHTPVDRNRPMGSYSCLVDLMGHEHLDGKAMLFLIDALYAAVNQGSSAPSRWQSAPFDNDWTSSLLASQDGVALDSVAVDFCRTEPALSGQVTGIGVDNYLHEAALADNPPSGIFYDPEGDGSRLASLGVHEHWNNAVDKQYSRNLGTGDGIELFIVGNEDGFRRGDVNTDGSVDISDAIGSLLYLFLGGVEPICLSSADADDTGEVDLSDAIYLLTFLFQSGSAPPPPFVTCGVDPTDDALECFSYPPCAAGTDPGTAVKLLTTASPAQILIPSGGSEGLDWVEAGFDDSSWSEGHAAVGYDENPDYLPHIRTDLEAGMNGVSASAYLRIAFDAESAEVLDRLTLQVKYDDGFVAYLNGGKVAERNAPAAPAWDSVATNQNDDSVAVFFESVDISSALDRLQPTGNVLAIHGLNISLTSSDFLLAVELEGRIPAAPRP